MGNRTGVKGLDLRFDVSGGQISVAIEINTHGAERDEALWAKLENCRKLIERHFESPLTWDPAFVREAGNTVRRVYISTEGDIYNKESWPELIHFMIDNMLHMEAAYKEISDYMIHF